MPTFTAVLVVLDELSQEYVEEQLSRLGTVAFLGAGVQVPAWRRNDARESKESKESK